MTIENWLTIAFIIATLIGPIRRPVAKLFKSRSNQPEESPDLNQPKTRIRKIGGCVLLPSKLDSQGLVF